MKGNYDLTKKVVNSLSLISLSANVGDAKTLIIHPASSTHQQLSEEEQLSTGVTPTLLRLSVGIEYIDDLLTDLRTAFDSIAVLKKEVSSDI